MDDIVIVSAARTAVGSFNGALGSMPAHDLGAVALQAAMGRAGVDPADIDELIYGQVLAAGEGPPACPTQRRRSASIRSAGRVCVP